MINKIYVLESIPFGETQTGEELYNDTISRYKMFYNSPIEIFFEKFDSKENFKRIIKDIEDNVVETDEIVLHIETHGAKDVMALKNNEDITWNEFLDILISLNTKIKNKLFLNLVACFGRYAGVEMDLKKTSPYKCYISSSELIYPREIIADNTYFYDNLLQNRNFYESYLLLYKFNPDTKFYIKDVETVLSYHILPNINLFLNKSSSLTLKHLFDHYLNININLQELENVENKSLFVFEKFINRFTYKN